MCGIGCIICNDTNKIQFQNKIANCIRRKIEPRGPDAFNEKIISTAHGAIQLMGAVLNMRSDEPVIQPITTKNDNVLVFNGEIYQAPGYNFNDSDTLFLTTFLENEDSIVSALSQILGPWSLVYWHAKTECVYFGRDPIGRRSLLKHKDSDGNLFLSSVAVPGGTWTEIPAGQGIFRIRLNTSQLEEEFLPWPSRMKNNVNTLDLDHSITLLRHALEAAVAVRIQAVHHRDVGILFSGGLDCTVIAALAHKYVPMDRPIDLFNVTFEENSPDRETAIASFHELCRVFPERKWNFVCINKTIDDIVQCESHLFELISPKNSHMDFNIGAALWFAASGKGMLADRDAILASPPPLADTAAIEMLLGKQSFEKESGEKLASDETYCKLATEKSCGGVRKAKCKQFSCGFCCKRFQINHGVDCTVHRLKHKRKRENEMGKSQNEVEQPVSSQNLSRTLRYIGPYESSCTILLSGIGADEYLGGYGRHLVSYKKAGWEGLRAELKCDRDRLWERNLGRDDRCISDHGKEVRQPFLDENVIDTIDQLPVEHLIDPSMTRGVGEKRILRRVCYSLGLHTTATFSKRAIQFGTRIAQISNRRAFGSNSAFRGDTVYSIVEHNN